MSDRIERLEAVARTAEAVLGVWEDAGIRAAGVGVDALHALAAALAELESEEQ